MSSKLIREMIQGLSILIVDDNQFMRRQTRTMLVNLGAKIVFEAADGLAALEIVRTADPDVMVLDRDIPMLSGFDVLRIVRSPDLFARPSLPIIMLDECVSRSTVIEAMRLGAHEFLVKPTSAKALQDRLVSLIYKPRPMVRIGDRYIPQPRRRGMAPVESEAAAS